LNLCSIVVAILKMATARNFSMSGIYSGHQNYHWSQCRGKYSHYIELRNLLLLKIKKLIFPTRYGMLSLYCLIRYKDLYKYNLPTYEMSLKSDNVEFVRYCGGHFENGDC
jgi:hypothetical protein